MLTYSIKLNNRNYKIRWASLVAQMLQNLPATQETQLRSLGQEDPLEKGMSTHSSILAWRTPFTEDPAGLQSMGLQRVRQGLKPKQQQQQQDTAKLKKRELHQIAYLSVCVYVCVCVCV